MFLPVLLILLVSVVDAQRTNAWYKQCARNLVNECAQKCQRKSGMSQTKVDATKFCFKTEMDSLITTRDQCAKQNNVPLGDNQPCWKVNKTDKDQQSAERTTTTQSSQGANPFLSDATVLPFLNCMGPCLKDNECASQCTVKQPANIPAAFNDCLGTPIASVALQAISCVFGAIGFGS